MFASLIRFSSRTTYRGSKGSGPGASGKTSAKSSPFSRPTLVEATLAGRVFKRSQRGLYDGAVLQSGNNLPKSRHKTARTWAPNVQKTKVWSDVMGKYIQLKLTTRAMRTVKKLGGLDKYLVSTRDDKLGQFGRNLREKLANRILQQDAALSSRSSPIIAELPQPSDSSQPSGSSQASS